MKRGLVFIGLVLLLAGIFIVFAQEDCSLLKCPGPFWNETAGECQCSDFEGLTAPTPRDIIIRLSASTNAHGEIPYTKGESIYDTQINYSNIFGILYQGEYPNICTGDNLVLRLSDSVNAHAEDPGLNNYDVDVCYGDLSCTARFGSCQDPEKCVVRLSDTTNAHLEKCDNMIYPYAICCEPGLTDCESLTTKMECWPRPECTWTPPFNSTGHATTSNEDGGGCCGDGEVWNNFEKICVGSDQMCTTLWTTDRELGKRYINGKYQYCAQITSGLSYGFWYDVKPY